jgi:hypothetical protein
VRTFHSRSLVITLFLFHLIPTYGAEEGRFLPVGIVGPSVYQSISTNPGALAGTESTRLSGFLGPNILNKGFASYEGGFTHTNEKWGGGINLYSYLGETLNAGFGFRASDIGVGFNIDYPFANGSSPGFDLGFQLGGGKGVNYAVVLYNLTASPSVTLGVGYLDPGKFTIETNLSLPAFSVFTQNGSSFGLSAGASVYEGVFGLSFFTTYNYTIGNTQSNGLSNTFAFMINPESFPLLAMHFRSDFFSSIELTFEF